MECPSALSVRTCFGRFSLGWVQRNLLLMLEGGRSGGLLGGTGMVDEAGIR